MLLQVCAGTQAFHQGPAMTEEQCQQALAVGAEAVAVACEEMAAEAAQQGVTDYHDSQGVLCIGELGIANTTSAAALVAALCPDLTPHDVCGRGTGRFGETVCNADLTGIEYGNISGAGNAWQACFSRQ